MGKYINLNNIDLCLNDIKTNGNLMVLCSAQPATYADAFTNYKLASVAMASGDFTLANGDTSGRKITMGAKTGCAVTTSGTGTHVAIVDTVNSILKLVTTTPSTAVASGGTVDIGSWKDEIQAPT